MRNFVFIRLLCAQQPQKMAQPFSKVLSKDPFDLGYFGRVLLIMNASLKQKQLNHPSKISKIFERLQTS